MKDVFLQRMKERKENAEDVLSIACDLYDKGHRGAPIDGMLREAAHIIASYNKQTKRLEEEG